MADSPLPTPADPFTLVHRALWEMLTGFPEWLKLIAAPNGKAGNLIRFDAGLQFPPKLGLPPAAGDFPQVALAQGPFRWEPHTFNSVACGIEQHYPLVITARNLNVLPLNAIRWQTIRALDKVGPQLGMPKLVRRVTVRGGEDDAFPDATRDRRGRRGEAQWVTFLSFVAEMTVKKSDLAAGLFPAA